MGNKAETQFENIFLDILSGNSKVGGVSCRKRGQGHLIEFNVVGSSNAKRIQRILKQRGYRDVSLRKNGDCLHFTINSKSPISQFFRSEFPWSTEEEELLECFFLFFFPIELIADAFMRTPLAIASKISSRFGVPLFIPSGYELSDSLFAAMDEQIGNWYDSVRLTAPNTSSWYQSKFGNYRPLDPIVECLDRHSSLQNPADFFADLISSIRFLRCKDSDLVFKCLFEILYFCENETNSTLLDIFIDNEILLTKIIGLHVMGRSSPAVFNNVDLYSIRHWDSIKKTHKKTLDAISVFRAKEIFDWLKYGASRTFCSNSIGLENFAGEPSTNEVCQVLEVAAAKSAWHLRALAKSGSRFAADAGILLMRDPLSRNEEAYEEFIRAQIRMDGNLGLEQALQSELKKIDGTLFGEIIRSLRSSTRPFLLRYGTDDLSRDRSPEVYYL